MNIKCSYCDKELKKPTKFKIDNLYFCNSTHLKKYSYEQIKKGNFEEKYIKNIIDFETRKFLNSNFKIEDELKAKILCWLWKYKGNAPRLCPVCGKDLCKHYIEKNGFYNPFTGQTYCSNKCASNDPNLNEIRGKKISEKSEIIKEKRKHTSSVKYGDENFNNREKAKKTSLEKYGVESHMKLDVYRNNLVNIMIEKYGVKNIYQLDSSKHHMKRHIRNIDKLTKEYIQENFVENGIIQFQKIKEFYGFSDSYLYKLLKVYNIDGILRNSQENKIYQFIKENYNGEIITNSFSVIRPYQLDIYIPAFNFAIEYDRLFFHSQGNHEFFPNLDKNYHLRKTEMCEERDIHLFHIFSNEWIDPVKQDIWKSKILLKLKSPKIKKYNARDGIIKEIKPKEARLFLNENHLQGYIDTKIKLGFFIDNELLAVMTLGKSRFKKDEFEIIRFASKKYITIRGIFGKFLKYFERNYVNKLNITKLVSYGNRRWTFKNNVYQKFMELESITDPNFFYFVNEDKLHSRIKFQKHKLKNILNNYNNNLSAEENMFLHGYRKIYDCGNYKYTIKY